MSTVSKSFTATGVSLELLVRHGESFSYAVSGTFVGTVVLEQLVGKGGWAPLVTTAVAASGTLVADAYGKKQARFRWHCPFFTSGTIVTSIADVTSESTTVIKDSAGAALLNASEDGLAVPSGKVLSATSPNLTTPNLSAPLGAVACVERTFTETGGALTYTGAVVVPAGATILDIIINGVALWDNAGAVTMKVGDTDDDGFYTNINLKATDLLAGESLSFALAGGKAGAYIANSQVSPRYSSTDRTINGIITTASTGGSAGRTRMTVVYALPVAADITAATSAA